MAQLKNRFIDLQGIAERRQSSYNQLHQKRREAQHARADLDKINTSLSAIQKNIAQLQLYRADLGPFKRKEKKDTDQQIQRLLEEMTTKKDILETRYRIKQEQIPETQIKLQNQIAEADRKLAQLPDSKEIIAEQRAIEKHYKTLLVHVEVLPVKEEVLAAERDYYTPQKHFIMQRVNAENRLRDITPGEYQQIKEEAAGNIRELLDQRDRQGGREVPRYAKPKRSQEHDHGRDFTFER